MEAFFSTLLLLAGLGALTGLLGLLHRQVPEGQALVISPLLFPFVKVGGATPRIVTRGAAWSLPLVQRVRILELGLVTLEVDAAPASTPDGEALHVRAAAIVGVGEGTERLATAADHFAGKTSAQREAVLHAILARALHVTVDGLTEEAVITGGPALAARVTEAARADLAGVGADMLTLTITEGRAGGV